MQEKLSFCGSKLMHDHTFQMLFGLSVPISKSTAKEQGWIRRSAGGSRFTSVLSMFDQNLFMDERISENVKSKLETNSGLFRTLASGTKHILRGAGRIIQKYGFPSYVAGYMGHVFMNNKFEI